MTHITHKMCLASQETVLYTGSSRDVEMFSTRDPTTRCQLPGMYWETDWMEELAGVKDMGDLLEFRL